MLSRILSLCAVLCLVLSIEATATQQQRNSNDVVVLNFALTLEHLEATFYTKYQALFTSADFVAANFTAQDYNYFNMIMGHENTHVSTLQSIIGASAVQACTYDFPVTNVKSYVALAYVLESTGVMAYDGALKAISNRAYQQAAATIATVEARHTEYLAGLNGDGLFPAPFDTAKTPAQIKQAVAGLIVSCPQPIVLPTYLTTNLNNANVTFSNGTTTSSGVSHIASANDIKTLNFALVLEHLESAYYNLFLTQYTDSDFTAAGFPAGTYAYFDMIRQHENTHVSTLASTISQLGANPYPVCTYDFSSVKSVADFVSTADTLENTGVMAYDGAANTITNQALLQVAATIATVEARHAAFLNMLNGQPPFPNAFDPTKTPAEIASVVTSFQSCSFTIYLPDVLTITALPPKTSSGTSHPSNPSNPSNKSNPSHPSGPDNKTGKTEPSNKSNPSHSG